MTAKTEVTADERPYDASGLPDVIVRYLDARDERRFDDAAGCFDEAAVVVDDGGTYVGRAAVADWIAESTTTWTYTTTRLRQRVDGPTVRVVVRIDGDFPGGTATLRQEFTVDQGRISRLHIAP